MKLKCTLVLAAMLLFSFASHAQSSCSMDGTLQRYEDARDQHLPAQDALTGQAERDLVETAMNKILEGLNKGYLKKYGGNPGNYIIAVLPLLNNAANLQDMVSQDEDIRLNGALGILNNSAWSFVGPLELDNTTRSVLYGLQGDPDSYVGEMLDAVNRRQVYRSGCKDEVWGLAHYDPRSKGELYEPKIECEALGVNFDPMLFPAADRGGITETVPSGQETDVITKVVICAETGSTPASDPNEEVPDFHLTANAYITYYLTRLDAFREYGMKHYAAQTSPEANYEARQAVSPTDDAFATAWMGDNGKIGALAYYRSRNVLLQLLYYSQYEILSSVPPVSAEQQVAQQIIAGASTP